MNRPLLQAYNGHTPKIDPQAWVHPRATLIGQVEVGAESTVWPNVTLRGDDGAIRIGSQTSVQDGTVIHATEGRSENQIGSRVTIGHNCTIHGARVDDECIIGMGSILLDNAHIPRGCIVGAGSLVTQGKTFPPGHLILGSPAKAVRPVTAEEEAWIAYSWRRYVEQGRIYGGGEGSDQ